jgi:hypothetical protein
MTDTIITCEEIAQRDLEHQHLDVLCGLFPEAKVVTLLHAQKQVLGPIEQRPIRSSFLSRHFEKVVGHKPAPKNFLASHPISVLAATNKLSISCSTELLINFSRGLSHSYKTCAKTQVATYLMDWSCLEKLSTQTTTGRMFRKYFWHQSLKALSEQKQVFVSSKSLRKDLVERLEKAKFPLPAQLEVLHPYTDIDEFPMVEKENFVRNHVVINGKNASTAEIEQSIGILDRLQLLWTLVGVTGQQEKDFALRYPNTKIHTTICSGELFPLFASCLAVIDLSADSFPEFSLKAFASGRPVVAALTELNSEFFPSDDPYVVKYLDPNLLHMTMLQWKQEKPGPQVRLHRFAQGFREVYFKQKIFKLLANRQKVIGKLKPFENQL